MSWPDFFIIGAPKCGTTSLAAWLREHPGIYMPRFKEPHFFNSDHNFINTPSWDHYRSLFRDADPGLHRAVGEASVWYLYSERAVPEILRHFPEARLIALVRNPVEMAYALFEQQRFSGMEHLRDFEAAWRAQAQRKEGRNVASFCREPKHLLYAEACSLGCQLERLHAVARPEQILTLVLDDFRQDPRAQYLRVLEFLGLEDDQRREFPVLNSAKSRRLPMLTRMVGRLNRFKNKLGIWNRGLGILAALDAWNIRYRPRQRMPEDLRAELESFFSEEIDRLQFLLQRDLTHWYSSSPELKDAG